MHIKDLIFDTNDHMLQEEFSDVLGSWTGSRTEQWKAKGGKIEV